MELLRLSTVVAGIKNGGSIMLATRDQYNSSACTMCPVRDSGLCLAIVSDEGEGEGQRTALPHSQRGARARALIYSQGTSSNDFMILCYGVAFRFNRLQDGRRKIHSFLQSGDPVSITSFFKRTLPFSVEALTDVRFSLFKRAELQEMIGLNPRLLPAIANVCVSDEMDMREQAIDLAMRSAEERVAHLILRFIERMDARHVIKDGRYPFPLLQQDIAEFTGVSLTHANRVIVNLRKAGLIEFSQGMLRILNLESLRAIGDLELA
jgi:CRP-like cAMP-binding protein